MRQQLRAMNDGNAMLARRGDVRHRLFDRRRDHQCGAVRTKAAAVLRQHGDAETLELGAQVVALAAVERAVAAARPAAGHHLELGERAHAGAAEPGVVKAAAAPRIGDDRRFRRGDEHQIAFAHAVEQLPHMLVRQPHAAMGQRAAERIFLVGAVQIDVARKRVAAGSAIDPVLQPVERQDAGQDQIVVARLAAPTSRRWARATRTPCPARRTLADPRLDAVPAGRRAERVFLAADAVARRRHRPGRRPRSPASSQIAIWRSASTTSSRSGNAGGAPGRDRPWRASSSARVEICSGRAVTGALCHNASARCYPCFGLGTLQPSAPPRLEQRAAIGIVELPVAILIRPPIRIVAPIVPARVFPRIVLGVAMVAAGAPVLPPRH